MRPKAAFLFAFLAVSWSTLLLATPPPLPTRSVPCCGAVEEAQDKKGKGGKKAAFGTEYFVCPIYCYAFWGTHCSYYGEKCHGEYVSLDAECNLPSVWPCDPKNENCVAFGGGSFKGKKNMKAKGKPPHASKGLRKGLMKKSAHDFKPTPSFPSKLMAEGLFAFEFEKGKKECTVKLFKVEVPEVIIAGKKLDAQTFYHAIEVEPPMIVVHDGKIPNGDIDVVDAGGKVCTFERNGKTYQCIVHKSRTIVK